MAIREGRWDCPTCGVTGLLGRDRDCQNCGAPRPEGIRFYQKKGLKPRLFKTALD